MLEIVFRFELKEKSESLAAFKFLMTLLISYRSANKPFLFSVLKTCTALSHELRGDVPKHLPADLSLRMTIPK